MRTRSFFSVLMISCLFVSACSRGGAGSPSPAMGGKPWEPHDMLVGPVGIVKGVFSVPLCPMRLMSKTIEASGSDSMSGTQTALELLIMPVKGIIDGAFTGVGYVLGGAVDTLSGGTLGVIENAEGEDEPNSSVHCLISGTSE